MHYLLILDGRPLEGRFIEILSEPSASYLSRAVGPEAASPRQLSIYCNMAGASLILYLRRTLA